MRAKKVVAALLLALPTIAFSQSADARFVQSDPIGQAAGPNTYAYANSNPTRYIDPLGLRPPNAAEKAFVVNLFGDCFDADSLDIQQKLAGSRAWSPYGTVVSFPQGSFINGDINQGLDLSIVDGVFAHEVFHVWQRSQGANVTSRLIAPQIGYSLGLDDPYAYSVPAGDDPTIALNYFNGLFAGGRYEAQAELWENSYLSSGTSWDAAVRWGVLRGHVASRSCECKK